MVALELVALALSVLGPFVAQKHSARIAVEDSIARSHETFNAPVLTATLPPAVATTSIQIAAVSSPEIEAVSLLDTSTNCVFEELCDTTTNILSWRIRFSYGLLASAGFITSPDAAHTALQRIFHQNAAQLAHASKLAVHTSPEKASAETSVEPGPMKGSWSPPTYSHEVIATIVVVGSRGTKTYATGHILEPTPTTPDITDLIVRQHASVDECEAVLFEAGQMRDDTESWLGEVNLFKPDPIVAQIDSKTGTWLRGIRLWIGAMVFLGLIIYLWNNSPDDTSTHGDILAWSINGKDESAINRSTIPPDFTTVDSHTLRAPPTDRYGSWEISAAGSTISPTRKQVDQYQRYAPAPAKYRSGGRALVTSDSLTLAQADGLARLQARWKTVLRNKKQRDEIRAWNTEARTAYGDGERATQRGLQDTHPGSCDPVNSSHAAMYQHQTDLAVAGAPPAPYPSQDFAISQPTPAELTFATGARVGGIPPLVQFSVQPAPKALAHATYGTLESSDEMDWQPASSTQQEAANQRPQPPVRQPAKPAAPERRPLGGNPLRPPTNRNPGGSSAATATGKQSQKEIEKQAVIVMRDRIAAISGQLPLAGLGLLGWILADPDSALKAVQNIIYTNQSATTLSVPAHSNSSAAGLAITTYIPWTSRLSYGIMGTIGFLTSPESAHDALQKVLDRNYTKTIVTAQISPASAVDSTAAASTAATPISLTNEAPHAAPSSTSLTLNSLTTEAPHAKSASSATRTPTLITGNPGTVTHIMHFEADATPIVPEFRTAQRNKLHTSTRVESDEDSETSSRMEYWTGYLDILTPFPYPGALHALFFAALFLAVVLVLLYSLRAPTHPEMMEALKSEHTARKYAEKQLTLEKQARKRAEATLALLHENRQHGLSKPHEVETLKADLKAARTTSSDGRAALQKCWLQIEELKQQVELNEVSYKSKMRSKDAELKELLKKISQSEVESRTPLEDHTTRQESTERYAVAAGENGKDESADIRTTRPPSPQTTSESLHDEENNEDSSAKQAAAPGGNDDDESATNRSTIPSGPQDTTIPLPYGAGEDRSTPSHTAAPSAYGGGESALQSKPLLEDNIGDDTTNNDAPAPGENGGSESATDDRTIPQAGQDDDEPLRDANTVNNTTAIEAPTPAEYGDDERADAEPVPRVEIPPPQQRDEQPVPNAAALSGYGGNESATDRSTVPQAPLAAVPSASGSTASPFPAAKIQLQIKRQQKQKQTSSPLRPNNGKTGIRKKPLEKPARKLEQRLRIPLLQQHHEQPVPNATPVGGYGDSEMLMAEPEPEHLPPPPQHDEKPLPMAAAPGLRGDAEIEPPAEQVVDDMAVDDEPVVAAEEQPMEMELDGEGGEQVEGNGERSEQMEVEGADGPAADQQDGKGRDVDAATVANQQQNNVQPSVRLAQLSVAQQGKQERMEQRRKIIAQARDILMAAKEEKEVNQSKWST
ncbi:hypothetical protein LTR56_021954 [Elasticomyces elasticus]|nr:hypothetical protein LTR56_021954 [Elasticomyces elasticus]KAK3629667.1 hypothetical protein LTR22_021837 [Elasticomyces elasticus]KAK4911266.1 hypothetical protein LTR49_020154 [Elasticomyces elasticus]KAK5756314.1 hypothetical protein LTS12_013620 [Elasticomyces elasticus]